MPLSILLGVKLIWMRVFIYRRIRNAIAGMVRIDLIRSQKCFPGHQLRTENGCGKLVERRFMGGHRND